MDKISKALLKFSVKEKKELQKILAKIKSGDFSVFDIKKLKGRENIFRVRKGKIRIIFLRKKDKILILAIEKRNDKTYKF